jgi:hypothetical protein
MSDYMVDWIRRITREFHSVLPDEDAEDSPLTRAQSGNAEAARDWESEGGAIEADEMPNRATPPLKVNKRR